MTAAPRQASIRVLIADDQRVVRDGLSMLVALIDGVQIIGSASDGDEALRMAEKHRPDVVLMDLRMPGMDGITATAELHQRLPATRVLGLTTYADDATILPALRAGALGYLTKDASAVQIEAAIRAVHAGQTHLDPAVQQHLVAAVTSHPPDLPQGTAPAASRRAHHPRGGGARPAGLRPQQRRDRRAPVRQQRHGENPHQPDLRQDRRATEPKPSVRPTEPAWRAQGRVRGCPACAVGRTARRCWRCGRWPRRMRPLPRPADRACGAGRRGWNETGDNCRGRVG